MKCCHCLQVVCGTFDLTVRACLWTGRAGTWWRSWRGGASPLAAAAAPAAASPAAARCAASTCGGNTSAGKRHQRRSECAPPTKRCSDVIRPSLPCLRCPGGQVTVTDDSGQQRCVPSPCGSTSCRNGGVCQALSPDSYRCRCQDGFRGQHCELGQVKGHRLAALSPSSILAISMCLLVFFGETFTQVSSLKLRSCVSGALRLTRADWSASGWAESLHPVQRHGACFNSLIM